MNNELDVAALESVGFAENYNNHVLRLFTRKLIVNEKIVDFGAGYGLFTNKLITLGYDVASIEINEKAIKILKNNNIENYKNIAEVNKKIDSIISLNVLEHIDDDLSTLKSLNKALKKGGKLYLYLPASKLVWTKLDELVNHKRRYSKKSLSNALENSQFEIKEMHYVDFIGWAVLLTSKILKLDLDFNKERIIFYDRFIFRFFKFLDSIFKYFIGKNIFVEAEKISD